MRVFERHSQSALSCACSPAPSATAKSISVTSCSLCTLEQQIVPEYFGVKMRAGR